MRRSLIVKEYGVLYNFRADLTKEKLDYDHTNTISVCVIIFQLDSVNQGKISVEYSTVSYLFHHP